jgi:tRNA1(Val) A37 N6-methylase TrmN6
VQNSGYHNPDPVQGVAPAQPSILPTGAISRDALFNGRLLFWQPKAGYRVNIDALLLATFAQRSSSDQTVLDLGAGIGVVSLILHHLGAARRFLVLERETKLIALARSNLSAAGTPGEFFTADLARSGLPRSLVQSADLVVTNPPFFDPRSHRPAARIDLRHARMGALQPFVAAAARALKGSRSRAAFVYPASGLSALLSTAGQVGLVAKRMRFVHAQAHSPARVVLVEFKRARPGGLVVEPPLIEWRASGERSAELSAILACPATDRK